MTKLAFWIHQFVEFAIGFVLLSEGSRSGKPVLPMVAGALLLVVAATADGPLRAVGKFSRSTHRTFDLSLVGLMVAGAAVPGSWGNVTSRTVLAVCAGFWLLLIWRTDYRPKPVRVRRRRNVAAQPRPPQPRAATPTVTAGDVGRATGRVVGVGVKAYRRRAARRS